MSLADFDHTEVVAGYRYELSRGVITVSKWPDLRHLEQVCAINQQLYLYSASHPKAITIIAGGAMSKIMAVAYESERHPDVSVYKTKPPCGNDIWHTWVPEIVIEVVSPESKKCDYEEKPPEYFSFGVAEYWIFDEPEQKVVVLRRVGERWQRLDFNRSDTIVTILLPDFELNIEPIFAAAANRPIH